MLSLGSIIFTVDELPERIKLGGSHVVAVRKYPGGNLDLPTAWIDADSEESRTVTLS